MSLLLVTGAGGMFVGAGGWPGAVELATMLVGLALACGGASALNHVIDRDIDRLMGSRTAARPVASGRVPAPRALEFGLVLSALSFALLASTVNVLTALLALVGNLFYVVVYTGYLKRSTDQNIVIGGAAGAVPPLVGYAAATGSLALPALWLFLIVFLWTPPHFWALALMIKDHYAGGERADAARARAASARRRGRSCSTRSRSSRSRSSSGSGSGRSTRSPPRLLGAYFLFLAHRLRADASQAQRGRPVPLLPRLPRAALRRSGDRPAGDVGALARALPQEQPPGARALRDLRSAVRRRLRDRADLPPGRLVLRSGSGLLIPARERQAGQGRREPRYPKVSGRPRTPRQRRFAAAQGESYFRDGALAAARVSPDLELALRLADAADAIALGRFRARDLVVETKPDLTPVTEADREVEHELRAMLGAERRRDAILGEEQGASGSGRAALDRRPDRRDAELLARDPGVGDADRARGGRTGRARRRLRAGAPSPLVGRARRRRARGRRRRPRLGGAPARGRGAQLRARAGRSRRSRRARGTPAATATSGATCSSPRERSTARSTRSACRCWDLAAVQVIVEEAGGTFTDFAGRAPHRRGQRDLLERAPAPRAARGGARAAALGRVARHERPSTPTSTARRGRRPRRPGRARACRARRRGGRSRSARAASGGTTGSPSTWMPSSASASRRVSATSRRSRERSQPASRSASARGPSIAQPLDPADPRPALGERRPPRERPRRQARSETATRSKRRATARRRRPGAPGHSDESTTSRSQTSTISASACPSQSGSPAPAAEGGQVGDRGAAARSRRDAAPASPRSRSSITSESTSRPSADGEVLDDGVGLDAARPRPGTGTRKIVRAGWRSASPARTRFARGSQRGGAQTTWVIVLVRSSGSPSSSWRQRCRASFRSISATTPIRPHRRRDAAVAAVDPPRPTHQCLRQERPSRWRSSSAARGPQLPAA